jgi:vancomycin aglycone glucosyltransferase
MPPPPIHNQRLPRVINQLLWQVGAPITSWMIARPINAGRRQLGLRPIGSVLDDLFHQPVIVAADRDLGPIPADAPRTVVATDAFVLQSTTALDPRVAAFLAIDPAPVYVGFGSMVARRLSELASHAVAAARALGRRLLLAGGWAALDRHLIAEDAGNDVLLVDAVPHAAVLPRVAAAVHHGGAGTTAAAARAGVPQVILPHILDQFYWAHRVERLGLGPRGLPVDLVTADVLTERLDAALHDPRIRRRAAEAAPAIAARDGVDAAADHLERIAGLT